MKCVDLCSRFNQAIAESQLWAFERSTRFRSLDMEGACVRVQSIERLSKQSQEKSCKFGVKGQVDVKGFSKDIFFLNAGFKLLSSLAFGGVPPQRPESDISYCMTNLNCLCKSHALTLYSHLCRVILGQAVGCLFVLSTQDPRFISSGF